MDRAEDLTGALRAVAAQVTRHLDTHRLDDTKTPPDLREAMWAYLQRGGKCLRAAMLLWSYGAAGGRGRAPIGAAAAVEVYHTWTLVHDDVIDRDAQRRGGPTVHEAARRRAQEELGLDAAAARHYGLSTAILAGDLQHAWAISLLRDIAKRQGAPLSKGRAPRPRVPGSGAPAELVLDLIADLEGTVLARLAEGELLDVRYSQVPPDAVSEKDIIDVLVRKTAYLYAFAARAGARLAGAPRAVVERLSQFAMHAGTAFQLHDDVLGLLGSEEALGKPVFADLREGKRTTILHHAWRRATPVERRVLGAVVGNRRATTGELNQAVELLVRLGAVEHTRRLAQRWQRRAQAALETVPPSPYRDRLAALAHTMVARSH